jgi:cytochrome c1
MTILTDNEIRDINNYLQSQGNPCLKSTGSWNLNQYSRKVIPDGKR